MTRKRIYRFYQFTAWLLIGISAVILLGTAATGTHLSALAGSAGQREQISKQLQQQPEAIEPLQAGRIAYHHEQYAQAIALWQQALQAQPTDRLTHAQILVYLSLAYQQLQQWSEAEQAIADCFDQLQQMPEAAQSSLLAAALNAQGSLQFAQGQLTTALATWETATAAYATIGDEQGQMGTLLNQAQTMQALGLFRRARQTLATLGQSLQNQPDSVLKVRQLRSLGNTLRLVGELAAAQQVTEESLAIATVLDRPQDQTAAALQLGIIAQSQQDAETALRFYRQAANTATPGQRIQAEANQINLLLEMGELVRAEALLRNLQPELTTLAISRTGIDIQLNLAQSWLRLGDTQAPTQREEFYRPAAQMLATALQQAEILSDRRAQSYASGYLASLYERTQQWQESQKLTEQALWLAQAIDAAEIAYQWQWQLGRLLKQQGQSEAAIAAYRSAFQTLQTVRADLLATNPDLQFSFQTRVEPVYRELVDLLLQRSPAAPTLEQLQQAREVIESLRLAELDNYFRTNCLEGQSVAIDQVNQADAAIVYPIILGDRLEIILSLPNQALHQYTTPVSQVELEATLSQWRQSLERPFPVPGSELPGQRVYDWMIRPLADDLERDSVQTLVFVLDGVLRNVPMAALADGDRYLIEQYSVALAPGLRLLSPRSLQQEEIEVLAAGLTEERAGFSPLLNVSVELETIQAEVPSQILLNQAFTTAALQGEIIESLVPVVHLATHGQFSSNADETFVLAWDRPIPAAELSALLRNREEQTETAIELLVLSACETAAGDGQAALGIAGLAVQAGVRSVLASLWSLDDASGAVLAGEFYRQLTQPQISRAEALRQAQLSLLRNPDYRYPRHWAPYVLVGNWL